MVEHHGICSEGLESTHHLITTPLRSETNCRWLEGLVQERDLAVVDHPGFDIRLDLLRFLEPLEKDLDVGQRLCADGVPEAHHPCVRLCED